MFDSRTESPTPGSIARTCVGLGTLALGFLASLSLPARGASIKLFILAGQSNMVGYQSNLAELPPHLQENFPQVLWYNSQNQWETLQTPTEPLPFSQSVANRQGFGPEISLGYRLSSYLKTPIALVKYAQNGTNLERDWNPHLPDSLYRQTLARVEAAIADLSARGYRVEIAGFFWMQGESDAKNDPYMAGNYQPNLTRFILQLRRDLSQPQLLFVYGLIPVVNNQTTDPFGIFHYGDRVRTGQFQVNNIVPHTRAVETLDLSRYRDNLHFDSPGLIQLGYRLADRWFQAQCVTTCVPGNLPVDWAIPVPSLPFDSATPPGRQCLPGTASEETPMPQLW